MGFGWLLDGVLNVLEYSKGFKMAQNNGRRRLIFGRINVAKLQMKALQGVILGNLSTKMSDSVVSKAS